jgi:hypothetical protein
VNGLGASTLLWQAQEGRTFSCPHSFVRKRILSGRGGHPRQDRVTIPAEVGRSSGSSPGRGWTDSREIPGQSAFAGEWQLQDIEALSWGDPSPKKDEGSPKEDGGSPEKDERSPKKDEAPPERDEGSPQKDGPSPEKDEGSPRKDGPSPQKDEGVSPRRWTSPRK